MELTINSSKFCLSKYRVGLIHQSFTLSNFCATWLCITDNFVKIIHMIRVKRIFHSGQLVSADYSPMQNLTLAMHRTINGSYCRVSFYFYATSGIILSVYNPSNLGELWDSSEAGLLPEQWNPVNVHISYNFDPRVEFDLSFRVSGTGLLLIDDVVLHPCIDCDTG